ncbi:MAG: non-canonical purine NTP pyrophosphatase [Candidatus Nanosalina sp.]
MIQDFFGDQHDVEREDADIHEIQSVDREEVVKQKARDAHEYLGKPVIVDDFSFYFEGLGDFPGPLVKYLLKETGLKGLKGLYRESDGKCRTVCSVAYHDGEKTVTAEGELTGTLSFRNADPSAGMTLMTAFIPDRYEKELGELGIENHRHRAYQNLREKLLEN